MKRRSIVHVHMSLLEDEDDKIRNGEKGQNRMYFGGIEFWLLLSCFYFYQNDFTLSAFYYAYPHISFSPLHSTSHSPSFLKKKYINSTFFLSLSLSIRLEKIERMEHLHFSYKKTYTDTIFQECTKVQH